MYLFQEFVSFALAEVAGHETTHLGAYSSISLSQAKFDYLFWNNHVISPPRIH